MVITIARSYGSGGKSAGVELARRFGITCYENEILDMASETSGIKQSFFYEKNEKVRRQLFQGMLRQTSKEILKPSPQDKDFLSDRSLFNFQAEIIRYLAVTESCVIVGKCADYVLGDTKNVFRFFVDAPEDVCIHEIEDRLAIPYAQAERQVKRTNRYRKDYYEYYTGHRWKNPANYDMMLNSARIGRSRVADVIENYIRSRLPKEDNGL